MSKAANRQSVGDDDHLRDPKVAAWLEETLGKLAKAHPGLMEIVEHLRYAICHSDPEGAAVLGMSLGRKLGFLTTAKQQIADLDRLIQHAERPGTARDGKAKRVSQRHANIVNELKRRLVEHPHDSVDYARRRVADAHAGENGWSYASIRRATQGFTKN